MTNGWTDIRNADVVLAMGGNPAENHPVGFRFVMEARRNRNAKLVSIDPRFNRTAAVADRFVQIRAGTDIAFLGGLINHALTHNRYHDEYVRLFTNAPFLVSEQYAFDEKRGVFTGWDDEKKAFRASAVHDCTSHPADAFRYLSLAWRPHAPRVAKQPQGPNAENMGMMYGMVIPWPKEPKRGVRI